MEALAILGAVAVSAGAVLTLALKALSAERRAGTEKARADVLDANHSMVAAQLADTAEQLKDAQERIDDLANELVQCAADMPADGAYLRLLARLGVTRKTAGDHGDGASPVLHERSASGEDPDGLLPPGD